MPPSSSVLTEAQTNQSAAEAFWFENSYGKSSLTTTYTDVVTLPKNGIDYIGNFNTLLVDARQAAVAANSNWDYEKFNFHTVITNNAPVSLTSGTSPAGAMSARPFPAWWISKRFPVCGSHESQMFPMSASRG